MDFHLGYEIAYPISFIVYIFTEFFFNVFSFLVLHEILLAWLLFRL